MSHKSFDWDIAWAAQAACILEADAPKVGNVNRYHDFNDCSLEDFHLSALAVGRPLGRIEELGVGQTVLKAVEATRKRVSTNTNLGIILLFAPLAMAWRRIMADKGTDPSVGLEDMSLHCLWRKEIGIVLEDLTAEDTAFVYRAIRLASPSGMGQAAEHDVFREERPKISLLEAMKISAGQDMIARQYENHFEQVLNVGYQTLKDALTEGLFFPQAIAHTHLHLLSLYPDSLITRKLGLEKSTEVKILARTAWEEGGWRSQSGIECAAQLDRFLRKEAHILNPGTTADLVAAAIFVYLLEKEAMDSKD